MSQPIDPVRPGTQASGIWSAAFADLVDRLANPLWVLDVEHGRIVAANRRALELWRVEDRAELFARDFLTRRPVAATARLQRYQADFELDDTPRDEMWTIYPKEVPVTLRLKVSGFRLSDGRMGLLCEALSEIADTPDRLRSSEALMHTPVMISLMDLDGRPLYRNPAALASWEAGDTPLAARFADSQDHDQLLEQLAGSQAARVVARVRSRDGVRWHEIAAHDCRDAASGKRARLISETDVTAHKSAEEQIRYLAHHDLLTGLPNRTLVQSELERRIRAAEAAGTRLALVFIDLDHFKTINDSLGHDQGDGLLVEVARRLKRAVRKVDFVARLGGDEFLVCLSLGRRDRSPEPIARRILAAFDAPVTVGGRDLTVTASVGLCVHPADGRDLDTLMRHADLAMYAAKDLGRGRWMPFTDELRAKIEAQVEIEASLRRALECEEFELYYQPRLSVAEDRIIGAEALLRWHHPTRGTLLPGTFIPHAEKTGLIDLIGTCVIREAARQQRAWADLGHDISVSINLSARQFRDPLLMATVEEIVAETGCDPHRIQIEITESMLVGDDAVTAGTLSALSALGFSIAIDDFGTGYSNLATIQRHPIDTLKIDRSFIATLEKQPALAELIIGMCRLLGLETIAEGVETEEQLAWLRARNCHEYQGYLFSPAIPADRFVDLLEQQRERLGLAPVAAGRSPLWDLIPLVKRGSDVEWSKPEGEASNVRRLASRTAAFGRRLGVKDR